MIYQVKELFTFLFILIPLFLITGPAVPDLTITFGVIFALLWILFKDRNKDLLNENFVRITLILWLSLLFISFFSFNKEKSFQDSIIFLRFLLIPIFFYFFYFKNNERLNYLLLIIFILVVFVSFDTFFQFFNYSSRDGFGADIFGFKSSWYGRLTGPFGDELIPGSYVSKFGLVGYVYLLTNKKLNKKITIHSLYLGIILVVCFISGERMAFATFGLGLFTLLIFLKKNRITIISSIVIGLVSIFLINKFHPFYNDYNVIESSQYHQGLKIEKFFKCKENSKEICTKIIDIQPSFLEVIKNFDSSAYGEIYLLSLKMFKDNLLTGVGISNFNYMCENTDNYKEMMVNYNCTSHPHNTYIQWLAEGGLIVFVIFVLYLFYICNFIFSNSGDKKFKIISLVILLIMFWPIMSTGSLIKNWYGISVFFIIGVSLGISKLKNTI